MKINIFIIGGTEPVPKAPALKGKGRYLVFQSGSKPSLPHEYQFNLDVPAGKLALERSVKFMKELIEK